MEKDTMVSKVGRPPKFKTPLDLAQVADAYFKSCDDNPVEISTRKTVGAKQTGKGSEAKSVEVKECVPTPYTIEDFCDFANINGWTSFKSAKTYQTEEFSTIIRAIEQRIRGQQIRGSLVGLYNANLTARINGLAEKVDSNINVEQQQTASEALEAILGKPDNG